MNKNILKKIVTIENIGIVLIILCMVLVIQNYNKPSSQDSLGGMSGSVQQDSVLEFVSQGTTAAFRGDGVVINDGPAYLYRILIGNNLTGGGLILRNATDSTSEVFNVWRLTGDTLIGEYEMGMNLSTGISATVSQGLWTTFIFDPK